MQDLAMARPSLAALRDRIADLEGRPRATLPTVETAGMAAARVLPFGVAALDGLFAAGGLDLAALHEVRCPESRDRGAGLGFVLALLARLDAQRAGSGPPGVVVWIEDAMSRREGGRLDGPGLCAFGLDPGRFVFVRLRHGEDALWAMEDALGCSGALAVVGLVHGQPKGLDMTASRRLALRTRAAGRPSLLVRGGAPPEPTAATTRWRVGPARSPRPAVWPDGLGSPAFDVTLEKNRDGRTGRWRIGFAPLKRGFHVLPAPDRPAAPDPGDRIAAPAHRSLDPAGTGAVVAFRRVS